jgi:hypothetical protein
MTDSLSWQLALAKASQDLPECLECPAHRSEIESLKGELLAAKAALDGANADPRGFKPEVRQAH